MGFHKGTYYYEPNFLDISIQNLISGLNDKAYIKKLFNILNKFLDKGLKVKLLKICIIF